MKSVRAGIVPLLAICILFSSAYSEKLVEVSVQITKLRFLPSASSDTRGFARKGQRFVVDGESGPWYRIRLYNSIVWISKDAVAVLETSEPVPADKAVASAQQGKGAATTPSRGTVRTPPVKTGTSPTSGPTVIRSTTQGEETLASSTVPPESLALARAESPAQPATSRPSSSAPTFRPGRTGTPKTSRPPSSAPSTSKKREMPTPTRTFFSQFSRMPQVPSGEEGYELGFFQIAALKAPIFFWPETTAHVAQHSKKGDFFVVRETTDIWCKIALKDTAGWVLRKDGVITDRPVSDFFEGFFFILLFASLIIVASASMIIVFLVRRKTKVKAPRADSFHALIIARSSPNIQCVISNKTLAMEKYLSAIGFSVKAVHDLGAAQRYIARTTTDIVFIDWNISDDIPGTVEVLFANFEEQRLPLAIFFNVPDLSAVPLIPVLLRAYHLGASFSDHDISKLITPTILSKTSPKSTAASALEGDIAEGNLPEILQFIEIGKKTGCLLIESTTPLGMIYFEQGRIVHAAGANNLQGRDAISMLLGLNQGHFRFLLNKQPKTHDLNLSTLEVLMEWTKAEDEAHRD
ncbi:MAG: DUF4388 domain-containing protein [Chitinispirillaceae bacterium]|nr:DUF4388 domain-containing protein [Chitinispirillaceae bacterium]